MDKALVKPKTKSSKIINIISNCIFVPVMIILVVYFIYAVSMMSKNGVPSFFGQSYVRVLSNSMKPSFEKGDVVVLEKPKVSEIKEGDVVAFYYCIYNYTSLNGSETEAKDFKTGQRTYKTMIYFHKVFDIQYDNNGNTWFFTYGTNNLKPGGDPNSEDIRANYNIDKPTRGDHIIGRQTDSWLAGVILFMSSTMGMFVLVIVPCSVLLFTLLLNIIEIVDQMIKEKKQKLAFADDEVKERELDVTTIIEENEEISKKEK